MCQVLFVMGRGNTAFLTNKISGRVRTSKKWEFHRGVSSQSFSCGTGVGQKQSCHFCFFSPADTGIKFRDFQDSGQTTFLGKLGSVWGNLGGAAHGWPGCLCCYLKWVSGSGSCGVAKMCHITSSKSFIWGLPRCWMSPSPITCCSHYEFLENWLPGTSLQETSRVSV